MGCFDGFKLVVPNRFKHFQVTVASSSINKAPQTFNLWVDPCQKSLTYIFGSNPSLVEEVFKCSPTNFCRNFALFRNQIPSNPDLKTKNKGLQILFQKFHGEYAHKNQNTAVLTELFGRAFYGTVVIAMCTQEPNFKFHDFTPDHLEELNQAFFARKHEEPAGVAYCEEFKVKQQKHPKAPKLFGKGTFKVSPKLYNPVKVSKNMFEDAGVVPHSTGKSRKFCSSMPTSPPRYQESTEKWGQHIKQDSELHEETKFELKEGELAIANMGKFPPHYATSEGDNYSLSFLEGHQPSFLRNYCDSALDNFCKDGFNVLTQQGAQQKVNHSTARLPSTQSPQVSVVDEASQSREPDIMVYPSALDSWLSLLGYEKTSPSGFFDTCDSDNTQQTRLVEEGGIWHIMMS
ncbi:unnamed protein product [Moneuplotes crassus]|uniref:Uncharacterized protein n=1 Tax=Euplotes crassus TaxID=5936 RepID=A0AAD1X8T1_EUPCR|nr:unnamed protein product [Moneuplotes crassus]